jgi:hypothetical protein
MNRGYVESILVGPFFDSILCVFRAPVVKHPTCPGRRHHRIQRGFVDILLSHSNSACGRGGLCDIAVAAKPHKVNLVGCPANICPRYPNAAAQDVFSGTYSVSSLRLAAPVLSQARKYLCIWNGGTCEVHGYREREYIYTAPMVT